MLEVFQQLRSTIDEKTEVKYSFNETFNQFTGERMSQLPKYEKEKESVFDEHNLIQLLDWLIFYIPNINRYRCWNTMYSQL